MKSNRVLSLFGVMCRCMYVSMSALCMALRFPFKTKLGIMNFKSAIQNFRNSENCSSKINSEIPWSNSTFFFFLFFLLKKTGG